MIRKTIALFLLLMTACATAWAINDGCPAHLNRDISFRTGPGSAYTETCYLSAGDALTAIETEPGDGDTWALCHFENGNVPMRGYVPLSALNLDENRTLGQAELYSLQRSVVNGYYGEIYLAPDDIYASNLRATVSGGDALTFLRFEGRFCMVEYMQGSLKERGYIPEDAFWVDEYEFGEWFPDNEYFSIYAVEQPSARMCATPNGATIMNIDFDRMVIPDYSSITSDGWMRIYCAGRWGYGRTEDFNDLRGLKESY